MRIVVIGLIVMLLAGCPMTNEQRIAAFKACNEAKMRPSEGIGEIICRAD
jgi:hypothetical protein